MGNDHIIFFMLGTQWYKHTKKSVQHKGPGSITILLSNSMAVRGSETVEHESDA